MELPRMSQAYKKPQYTTETRYVGVRRASFDEASPRSEGEQPLYAPQAPEIDLRPHPQLAEERSWVQTFGLQTFALLWLGPIVLLLIVNVKGYVIGASAWCPGGKCYPDAFDSRSSVPQKLMAKFDRDNHNLLGALQLVSKALEVWFILITSWLVYLITMFLAGKRPGLPIAYLTRPSEFAELPGLFDPLLWSTLPKPYSVGSKRDIKKARKRVWLYVFFTVGLCVLCNLMGPATAVLVLPSLQWITTTKVGSSVFMQLNSDSPPSNGSFAYWDTPSCTEDDFAAANYSCTYYPWGRSLDSWIDIYMASQDSWNGLSQQDMVSFTFNSTYMATADGTLTGVMSWAPNRQVIRALSNDWAQVFEIATGVARNDTSYPEDYDSYVEYNSSVQTFIHRNGPIIGVVSNMWLGYDEGAYWDTYIGASKSIRCYEGYNISETPLTRGAAQGMFTKCVKWGKAWDYEYKYASFTVEGLYKSWLDIFGPELLFETWTSDKAVFLPDGKLPTGFNANCLAKNAAVPAGTACDWDAFFTTAPDSAMYDRAINSNTIHISANFKPVTGHPTNVTLMFDFVAFQAFTDYSLDPSYLTNPLLLSATTSLPMSGAPIVVDPAWTLAAWSADNGGLIGANRTSSLTLLHAFDRFWDTPLYAAPQPLWAYWPYVDYVSLLPVIQTLSLVDFYTNATLNSSSTSQPVINATHPLLQRHARMNVWAYGMASRSAWLGVLVCSAGCVVVLVQVLFGMVDRRRYRSPTQLLVAALEHTYSAEFDNLHDERAIARTPFRVEDKHRTGTGKMRFSRTF